MTPTGPLRIALADDQALVRAGLRALLERQGIVVAFEADDGDALLHRLEAMRVDVVLSDIRMPGVDGITALQRLRGRGDATPVLLLTTVKNYVSTILDKLDTRDRTRAVLKAIALRVV